MNKSQRDGRNDIWSRIDDEKKNDLRLRLAALESILRAEPDERA